MARDRVRAQEETGGWTEWVAFTVHVYMKMVVFRTYSFDTPIPQTGIYPTEIVKHV